MKKSTLLILIFVSSAIQHFTLGQDTLAFMPIRNNNIQCPLSSDTLNLPLVFKFDLSYRNQTVAFFRSATANSEARLSVNGTFDGNILRDVNFPNNYFLTIRENRSIPAFEDEVLPDDVDTFFLKFGTNKICGPFTIAKQGSNGETDLPKEYEPGYLYFDALELKRLKDLGDNRGIKKILQKYGISTEEDLKKNPYLSPIFTGMLAGGEVQVGGLSSFLSSVGGLDVTKYANAIADIMIERAKQELTIAFFNRFKDFAEKNPEFKILFPKTTDNLSNLLTYTYPQMLPALRNGFFQDLKKITFHLDDVLSLPRYRRLLKDFPEVRIAIRSIRIVHELETGASNAADIINQFSKFDEWTDAASPIGVKTVGSCIKIGALFSESIRNDPNRGNKDDVWVPAKELKKIFYDETLFRIYVGLIYQKSVLDNLKYIDGDGEILFARILEEQKDNLFVFQNKLKEFFDLAGNVNVVFRDLQLKISSEQDPTNDDIYNYIDVSLDAVEYVFDLIKIFRETPQADNYLALARKSNNLYKCIYTKKYTQAVNDALDILSMLSKLIDGNVDIEAIRNSTSVKTFSTSDENVKKLIDGNSFLNRVQDENVMKAAESNIANDEVKKIIDHYNLKHVLDFIEKLKPYALFMANMVEAKSEGEVKAALENVILPVGSSSIKKNSLGNISVQTYLGAYLALNDNDTKVSAWSDRFGVIAPIGISWTPAFWSFGKGGSISLFGSLLDLGAIVDYKLKKDSVPNSSGNNISVIDKTYKVELGHIFSPGAYVVYGFFGNLPLSFGMGAQYGPGLSKIEDENSTVLKNPSLRWNVFFAVDMPFFTLKNKNRNYRPLKQIR